MRKTLLGIFLVGLSAHADDLVLKSGRRIEWAAIRDQGTTYRVETPAGNVITVKKSDVKTITTEAPESEGLLTGATLTWEKKRKLRVLDLARLVDPKRDTVTGKWGRSGSGLAGNAPGGVAKLEIPWAPPEEYDLLLDVSRQDGRNQFAIGLVAGGKQVLLGFDAIDGSWSGLHAAAQPYRKPGRFFKKSGPVRRIRVMIRSEAFVVQVDGKDFLAGKIHWPTVGGLTDPWHVRRQDCIFLVVVSISSYRIRSLRAVIPAQ